LHNESTSVNKSASDSSWRTRKRASAASARPHTRPLNGVTAPIIGPRGADQLLSALPALSLTLDGATLTRLDELFPRPGPAPEAYAW
jgi:aryl-alcohol dehydrogenase-like predicted oxidoreductase